MTASPHAARWPTGPAIAAAVLAASAMCWHASRYLPFFADDGFISLRYAQRLLAGRGLTFNDGEWVEGYSNLLWVLLVAVLGAPGFDLVTVARAVGLCGVVVAVAAVAVARRPGGEGWPEGAAPALALACSPPLAVWSIGGLEQGLVAGLLAVALVTSWPLLTPGASPRDAAVPGMCFAALCWTRPDGPLFAGLAALVVVGLGRDRDAMVRAGALLAVPAMAVLAQLGFRLAYYGEWVPNTALVKLEPSMRGLRQGASYVREAVLYSAPLSVAALLSMLTAIEPERRPRIALTAVVAAGWMAYVVVIGGDIFAAHRHHVATLVATALLASEGMDWLLRRRRPLGVGIGAFLVLGTLAVQSQDTRSQRANAINIAWNAYALGTFLRDAFPGADPLLACGAGGALPYVTGFRTIDLYGLTNRHIAKTGIDARLAHPILGDPEWLFDQGPDIIQFHAVAGTSSLRGPMGKALGSDPRMEKFSPAQLVLTDPRRFVSWVWFRVDSPEVGIQRRDGRVEVPGHLLGSGSKSRVVLSTAGTAVKALKNKEAVSATFTLPPGRWRGKARVDGDRPVTLTLEHAERTSSLDTPAWHPGGPVRLRLRADRQPALVHGVVLGRVD